MQAHNKSLKHLAPEAHLAVYCSYLYETPKYLSIYFKTGE